MIKKKLQLTIQQLLHGLIEREEAIKFVLLAALSGEHVLLIGSPGTAKSELARRLQLMFEDGQYFERLLTRFSVPEELFGPLSIKALENDEYRRLTKGYLPDASIAFIDEIFKANSAILNTLLTLLNEREFDNGDQRYATPLICVVAASNELPEEEELNALYDRFLLRYKVSPVSKQGFLALINLKDNSELKVDCRFSLDDLEILQSNAQSTSLSNNVVCMITALREFLSENNIYVSDRRWRKTIKLLKISALTNERDEVNIWDCWLLQHCLWDKPEQQTLIFDWYKKHIGTNEVIDLQSINKLVDVWQQTLDQEISSTVPLRNEYGEDLYTNSQGETTVHASKEFLLDRDGEVLFLSPAEEEQQTDRTNNGKGYTKSELQSDYFDDYYQQRHIDGKWVTLDIYTTGTDNRLKKRIKHDLCKEAKKFTQEHIEARSAELSAVLVDILAYQKYLHAMSNSVQQDLSNHLWVSQSFSAIASDAIQMNLENVEMLIQRVTTIRQEFQKLPIAA